MQIPVETGLPCQVAAWSADILGEVPLWCERTGKLWWVDVRRPALQSFEPATGRHQAIRLHPGLITGSIALREQGGLLLAAATGLHVFEPGTGQPARRIADPLQGADGIRLNDGKCDRAGRFWVGSMHDTRREPLGTLYRVDPDGRCTAMLDQFVLPNAICFSPDDRTMYFADTHNQTIWAFDFDLARGELSNRRVFKDWRQQSGRPDGATVDAEGFIWNCMVATGQLIRLAPDGRVDRVIQLPVTNPTCPAFGGNDLATLFITSHSQRFTPEAQAAEPMAGALLQLDVGVRGLPEPRFGG